MLFKAASALVSTELSVANTERFTNKVRTDGHGISGYRLVAPSTVRNDLKIEVAERTAEAGKRSMR